MHHPLQSNQIPLNQREPTAQAHDPRTVPGCISATQFELFWSRLAINNFKSNAVSLHAKIVFLNKADGAYKLRPESLSFMLNKYNFLIQK